MKLALPKTLDPNFLKRGEEEVVRLRRVAGEEDKKRIGGGAIEEDSTEENGRLFRFAEEKRERKEEKIRKRR